MRALKRDCMVRRVLALFVTTQAHEGIETIATGTDNSISIVTTQAHEGIETPSSFFNSSSIP